MLVLVFMLVVAFVLLTIRSMTTLIICQVIPQRAAGCTPYTSADSRSRCASETITNERAAG